MKRQIIFIIISIITLILSILLIEKMMDAVDGTGLGVFFYIITIVVLYSVYTLYHLFTYKSNIKKIDIIIISIIYWITILPYITIWIWELI